MAEVQSHIYSLVFRLACLAADLEIVDIRLVVPGHNQIITGCMLEIRVPT
jgi:hypothetical protein